MIKLFRRGANPIAHKIQLNMFLCLILAITSNVNAGNRGKRIIARQLFKLLRSYKQNLKKQSFQPTNKDNWQQAMPRFTSAAESFFNDYEDPEDKRGK